MKSCLNREESTKIHSQQSRWTRVNRKEETICEDEVCRLRMSVKCLDNILLKNVLIEELCEPRHPPTPAIAELGKSGLVPIPPSRKDCFLK
jgi:hypothetical protein